MKTFVTYIERDFWERAGQASNERPNALRQQGGRLAWVVLWLGVRLGWEFM